MVDVKMTFRTTASRCRADHHSRPVAKSRNLNFDCHIQNLEKKLSRSVGILAKVKPFLNSKTLLQLYYAIFHSHLKYGILAWSSTYKTFFKKLSILQNKSVKIIGGGSYYDRATPFYAKLDILKLADLVKFEKALFVFKFKMKTLPAQYSSSSVLFNDHQST